MDDGVDLPVVLQVLEDDRLHLPLISVVTGAVVDLVGTIEATVKTISLLSHFWFNFYFITASNW